VYGLRMTRSAPRCSRHGEIHLLGFTAERDEHLRHAVEQSQADAHLDQLGFAELGQQLGSDLRRRRATCAEERIRELQRQLEPR
jgi:hypothetical protein